jgi:chromosome segregation ATPase
MSLTTQIKTEHSPYGIEMRHQKRKLGAPTGYEQIFNDNTSPSIGSPEDLTERDVRHIKSSTKKLKKAKNDLETALQTTHAELEETHEALAATQAQQRDINIQLMQSTRDVQHTQLLSLSDDCAVLLAQLEPVQVHQEQVAHLRGQIQTLQEQIAEQQGVLGGLQDALPGADAPIQRLQMLQDQEEQIDALVERISAFRAQLLNLKQAVTTELSLSQQTSEIQIRQVKRTALQRELEIIGTQCGELLYQVTLVQGRQAQVAQLREQIQTLQADVTQQQEQFQALQEALPDAHQTTERLNALVAQTDQITGIQNNATQLRTRLEDLQLAVTALRTLPRERTLTDIATNVAIVGGTAIVTIGGTVLWFGMKYREYTGSL